MTSKINIEQRWDINSILLQIKNENVDEENKIVKVGFQLFEEPRESNGKHGTCYNGVMQMPIRDAEEMVAQLQNAIDDFYKCDASYVEWCAKQDVGKF